VCAVFPSNRRLLSNAVGRAGLWLCFVRLRQLLSSVLVFKARFKPAASSESVADYLQRQLSYSRQNTCWVDLDVIRRKSVSGSDGHGCVAHIRCRGLESSAGDYLHHHRRGARGDEPEKKARYMWVDTSTSIDGHHSLLIICSPEPAAEPSTAG
jgi:hypothetical protein